MRDYTLSKDYNDQANIPLAYEIDRKEKPIPRKVYTFGTAAKVNR